MHDDIIYGTYPLVGAALGTAVQHALAAGYRTFDTAQIYGNEADLGAALRSSGLPRDAFKVTTKIAPPNYGEAGFLPSLRRSLAELQLDQVDLLLLHFPPEAQEMPATLALLASAQQTGLARAVGVSNFTPRLLRRAVELSPVRLAINQVEFHPLLDGGALLAASAETGVPLQAYSPLARGAVLAQPVLTEIGRAHGKTAAQVAMRWILQQGLSLVTQSASPANIASNLASADFTLTAEDVRRIDALASINHRIVDRSVAPWAPVWN